MLSLALAALLASAPPTERDSLAALVPGLAATGTVEDLVLRPTAPGSTRCRLLVSDAETDAPVCGAKLTVRRLGATGRAPVEGVALQGTLAGHYLAECPLPGEVAVVSVEPREGSGDLFSFTIPAAPTPVRPSPSPAAVPLWLALLALALLGLQWRRGSRPTRWALLVAVILAASQAIAHGADELGAPVAAGDQVKVPQEIQFALGLRTVRVDVRSFASATAAARTYPAVPRSAVVERGGKKLVFTRLTPEVFVAREVVLGSADGTDVAVLSGLGPGELAVVSGAAFLRNGGAQRP